VGRQSADHSAHAANPLGWIDNHGDYLYNLAYSRLHNRAVAEDVVQETFLSALKARESFEGRSSERTWLVGILKRKIVDYLRSVYRDRALIQAEREESMPGAVFKESGPFKGHWISELPVDWGKNPSARLESEEFREVLETCMKQLQRRLAAVFVLREMEGLDTDSICKELDISSTNLWVALHRARTGLRRCLETNWMGLP